MNRWMICIARIGMILPSETVSVKHQPVLRAACCAALLVCLLACPDSHAGERTPGNDLVDMSLEALMDIEITSVSKRPEKKSTAAAAIYVITSNDLRRWGVTNIPDALRHVPGLQVARIDANKWAITARGFNSRFANKLLVLIDGRSVYTPLFAGVYWEANDVMLEDVERIEVIRGPGGSLWGANAVNGVINIITRSSRDTQGTLLAGAAGNEERSYVSTRYGGSTDHGVTYRLYGKFRNIGTGAPVETWFPTEAHDDGEFGQTGFRSDWSRGNNSHTLQGDGYRGHADQQLIVPNTAGAVIENAQYRGGNLLYRFTHQGDQGSGYSLQTYLDHVGLDSRILYEDRDTLDLDFQHQFRLADRHDVVWGLNYRNTRDNTSATPTFSLAPASRTVNLYSAFVQDEISLFDAQAKLTLGSKFEHNDFTGFEAQPNVRIAWSTHSGNTIWAAVSRAVRTPARGEHDVNLTTLPPPGSSGLPPLTILGNRQYDSETLLASELGYRFTPHPQLSVDTAAFLNRYRKLRTVDVISMPPAPFQAEFGNQMQGTTRGLEIDTRWQLGRHIALSASYSYLVMSLELLNSNDTQSQSAEDASPTDLGNLWLSVDLQNNVELDAGIRYSGRVRTPGMSLSIPAYTAFDMRIGWTPRPGLELSLTGQNLFDSSHPEYNPDFIFSLPTEVERSVLGKVTVKF